MRCPACTLPRGPGVAARSREAPEEYNQRKYGSSDPGPSAREVISIRSAEQEVAQPSFVPSITTSPANVHISEIDAQTHDERRMSWVWRSPSSGLLMSPLAYGVFRIKVTAPHKMSRANMVGTLLGVIDTQHDAVGATTGADVGAAAEPVAFGP